ncbi:MAG: glutamate synthase-related protein [Phototrophicaceae bacterium]
MQIEQHPNLNENDPPLHPDDLRERDACALICAVRKGGQATHGNVKRTIEALARMGHRTGSIEGEGDGVGIMTDIPRQLWTKRLAAARLRASLATDRNFWVAHVMIPATARNRTTPLVEQICRLISSAGLDILLDLEGETVSDVLGPNAKKNEPVFWQICGLNGSVPADKLNLVLFDLQVRLEKELGVHIPSMSSYSVVYKVQGTVEILRRYYPELRDPDFASTVTLGHARYSTNTNPIFERVQPFGVLGHNGEFNTVSRFKMEAGMLGIALDPMNSDSQDVDRAIHALCVKFGLDLIEAMELVFPPYEHDLIQTMPELKAMYREMRQAYGPFAQGPAAVAARHGDIAVFSVDALGLRPLWFGETDKEYFASSERGVYPLDSMISDPKPLAPGEKIALKINPGRYIEVMDYTAIQRHVLSRSREQQPENGGTTIRAGALSSLPMIPVAQPPSSPAPRNFDVGDGEFMTAPIPVPVAVAELEPEGVPPSSTGRPWESAAAPINTNTMASLGWERYHVEVVQFITEFNKEQIGSLGWDGPLAAISNTRVNLADYFKETVAVVTNPAIDRERESAQFSTSVIIGTRPSPKRGADAHDMMIQLETPLILGGSTLGELDELREVAQRHGTMVLEDILDVFAGKLIVLSTSAALDESIERAIKRIQQEAVDAVADGALCVVLDDSDVFEGKRLWIDPLLVTAAVDKALRTAEYTPNLRRRAGIILRSAAIRDLHDIAMCVSLGANVLLPYALYAVSLGMAPRAPKEKLTSEQIVNGLDVTVGVLTKGLQKVTSTIGCHELRGYGHSFSSVGLAPSVAAIFGMANYYGAEGRGLTWDTLREDADARAAELRGETASKLANPERFYPKLWKKVESVAQGESTLDEYNEQLSAIEEKQPIALRHIIGIKDNDGSEVAPEEVDLSIGRHDMPMIISAMSFGSQGELAYKAYAEAAEVLNTICVNGEGGEMADIMGRYYHNRGQQVASARFGVNIELLNSSAYIEIKIGQGAKPGEGGHLPGYKVTEQIAAVRGTTPGVGLISPSNNHDLYSIEDLAQLIDELHTANPRGQVSVKIPVVPGVGIIAVGVAKAGADIINLTGFEGGTGAARAHSLRHVGLPVEIGLMLAHKALIDSGLRENVELWVDGGMKSGRDVVKMLCMGANRIGFGTMAMVAVGCTICRGCHEGTCHVGITTHVKTREEAEVRGFKSFRPFVEKGSSDGIVRVMQMVADDVRYWVARMGFKRAQDLVGRGDLLEQISHHDSIDLTPLLRRISLQKRAQQQAGVGRRLARPRNTLTRTITDLMAQYIADGETELTYDDEQVMAHDRALGTHLAGALQRGDFEHAKEVQAVHLNFSSSSIPGNGLAAFMDAPLDVMVEGGAQDGVAKCAKGGKLTILKGLNHNGKRLDGSVGKSFAYGAQGGFFIVQGNADSRACIRLSGADVIFGGEVSEPLRDELGAVGTRANLKGYACEYMTAGRVLVMGDPGPWICAGMTGGVIYQRIQPEVGLTVDAIRRRIAAGSVVEIYQLDEKGVEDVRYLLNRYIQTLEVNNQANAVQHLYTLLPAPEEQFAMLRPRL